MATWNNFMLQDASSPLMEQLIFFHDHSLLILILITILVSYNMTVMMTNKLMNRFLISSQLIEIIWTVIPAVILMFIALPSIHLLYLLDEIKQPSLTIKTIGHQWYWSYEYSDLKKIEFDSYMLPTAELENFNFRLLDVDNRTVLPMNLKIRILISAMDVIHSWTIPSLGVKVDGNPGRLNQTSFLINRPGLFFGQCSEICGANHSFMPIVIESVNIKTFMKWVMNFK